MPRIITIETPSLGDRSYLVHDGTTALVVDPQRDIDRVLDCARDEGVTISDVFETHIHNDYVTGGFALAAATGARYHVNAEDEVSFERDPIRDGDTVAVTDTLTVRAIATPGHTFTHLSYALDEDGQTVGVFTGGSLLFGATGRPDLLGPENTDALAHHQYASAQRLAALPDGSSVLPTHGFGSFCSSGSTSSSDSSTIGQERRTNPALTQDEAAWVSEVLAALEEYPAYYVHMGPANTAGPSAPALDRPRELDREAIAQQLAAGNWVVDLRTRTAYAAGHVRGSVNVGLDGQFSTYLGWLMPWGTPLTLLADTPEQLDEAQRELARIGVDELQGCATGEPSTWTRDGLGTYGRARFADLAQVRHHRRVAVLDVRRRAEHEQGHLDGAVNIPVHELLDRLDDVPTDELWVHCASGYRASIAASLLAANGRHVVLVDDDFEDHARDAGLALETSA